MMPAKWNVKLESDAGHLISNESSSPPVSVPVPTAVSVPRGPLGLVISPAAAPAVRGTSTATPRPPPPVPAPVPAAMPTAPFPRIPVATPRAGPVARSAGALRRRRSRVILGRRSGPRSLVRRRRRRMRRRFRTWGRPWAAAAPLRRRSAATFWVQIAYKIG